MTVPIHQRFQLYVWRVLALPVFLFSLRKICVVCNLTTVVSRGLRTRKTSQEYAVQQARVS